MLLTRLEPETIPVLWPSIESVLKPALHNTAHDVRGLLETNRWAAWLAHGFAGFGIVVVELANDPDGNKCLFVRYVAGRAGRKNIRRGLALLEDAARCAGCTLSSIGGRRGWVRVFPEYDVTNDGGSYVELRKALR